MTRPEVNYHFRHPIRPGPRSDPTRVGRWHLLRVVNSFFYIKMTFYQSSSRHTHQHWLRIVQDTTAMGAARRIITMKPYKWMWSHLGLTVFQAIVASIHTAISTKTILTHSAHRSIYYRRKMAVVVMISLNSSLIFNLTLHTSWLWRHFIQAWQECFRWL